MNPIRDEAAALVGADLSEDSVASWGDDDTDEASENETPGANDNGREPVYTEIKEQMYRDKLEELRQQLTQLQEGTLPEYVRRLRRIESLYRERRRVNDVVSQLEAEMAERDFMLEKRAAAREFEDHKVYLREHLVGELEEKQKAVEAERHNSELAGDAAEMKPVSTRKLRRRVHDQAGPPNLSSGDKRRKVTPFSLTYFLEESEVMDDLKIINKNKSFTKRSSNTGGGGDSSSSSSGATNGVKVEDGKLFYHKRWFRRGQAVQVEPKSGEKYPAMITAIGYDAIWVRRTSDNVKNRIFLTQLSKGKVVLKRRAA